MLLAGIGVFGMPVRIDPNQVVVGHRPAELPAAKVDAGDHIAVRTVAVRAGLAIRAFAVEQVGGGLVLRQRRYARDRDAQGENREDR